MTWILLVALLGLSGLVSGSETAVFSLAPRERRRIRERHPAFGRLLDRPAHLLVSLLAANLLVNVAYFTLSSSLGMALADAGEPVLAGLVLGASLLGMVVLGEILPKTLALVSPVRLVGTVAPALLVLVFLVRPLAAVGTAATELVESLLLGRDERRRRVDARDFKSALASGAAVGTYRAVELALLHDVIDFAERRASALMVPRVEVVFLDVQDGPEVWREQMARAPHRDYPVVDGSPDGLLGTVNTQRLLASGGGMRDLVEPPLLAPDSVAAERLLLRMQAEERELAILLDEFGGVTGVVGLAELTRSILGEVEPLPRPEELTRVGDLVLVSGRCPLHVLEEEADVRLPSRGSDTVGGALDDALGRVARPGDELVMPGWRLRVLSVHRRRAERLVLRPVAVSDAAGAEGEP